eukprot:8407366-Pyramimonas_sp.AAC.1
MRRSFGRPWGRKTYENTACGVLSAGARPKRSPALPGAPRRSQVLPSGPRRSQALPNVPRRSQALPS